MATGRFSELREEIRKDPKRAERLARAESEVAETYETYHADLAQMRRARNLTQMQLAKALGISQPEVSRIERQTDVYLSTLRNYVRAMGGHLGIVADFGVGKSVSLAIGDVLERPNTPLAFEEFLKATLTRDDDDSADQSGESKFDIPEYLAASVIDGDHRIGALKHVAVLMRNRGSANLACLLFGLAGELAAGLGRSEVAGKDLGMAGALARRNNSFHLAEALWTRSIHHDPTNIRSQSRLGQLLHHQGRYSEAVEHLTLVADLDNYAANFLGWSLVLLGLEKQDEEIVSKGLVRLTSSLHKWCYEAPSDEKSRIGWVRQLRRLAALGPRFQADVENLIRFANSNANWPTMSLDDITKYANGEHETDDLIEEEEEEMQAFG